ncbi:hypothetical protein BC830DRAFT_169313 [Chytriomyces sp. MP71]|nr:hypothetical protein BC830DRAFT_169313 [Chytriomyces sp. MP71]
METTGIKPFGSGNPKTDDEKALQKNYQKSTTKSSQRYKDEVSNVENESLLFSGRDDSKGVKKREGYSRADEDTDEKSSNFDSRYRYDVIQSIHSLPRERPLASKKPHERQENESDTNSLSESISGLKMKAITSKEGPASGVKIQLNESIQLDKTPESLVINEVESTLDKGIGIYNFSNGDSNIEEKYHNAWSEMSHLQRFGTEVAVIGVACMAYQARQ